MPAFYWNRTSLAEIYMEQRGCEPFLKLIRLRIKRRYHMSGTDEANYNTEL